MLPIDRAALRTQVRSIAAATAAATTATLATAAPAATTATAASTLAVSAATMILGVGSGRRPRLAGGLVGGRGGSQLVEQQAASGLQQLVQTVSASYRVGTRVGRAMPTAGQNLNAMAWAVWQFQRRATAGRAPRWAVAAVSLGGA